MRRRLRLSRCDKWRLFLALSTNHDAAVCQVALNLLSTCCKFVLLHADAVLMEGQGKRSNPAGLEL